MMREAIEQLLHFQCAHAYPLPLNPEALCRALGIELRPLSEIARESGLSEREICACWGNEDGVLQRVGGRFFICFNDRKPKNRVRFTLCEEIAHRLLGHLDEPGFSAFRQDYREEVYARCEAEARLTAGLLLCPPRWYYAHEPELDERSLALRCGVSAACARRILADYAALGAEIRACATFGFAPINGEIRRDAAPGKNSCKSGADTVK